MPLPNAAWRIAILALSLGTLAPAAAAGPSGSPRTGASATGTASATVVNPCDVGLQTGTKCGGATATRDTATHTSTSTDPASGEQTSTSTTYPRVIVNFE
jgi:hypothetical protein